MFLPFRKPGKNHPSEAQAGGSFNSHLCKHHSWSFFRLSFPRVMLRLFVSASARASHSPPVRSFSSPVKGWTPLPLLYTSVALDCLVVLVWDETASLVVASAGRASVVSSSVAVRQTRGCNSINWWICALKTRSYSNTRPSRASILLLSWNTENIFLPRWLVNVWLYISSCFSVQYIFAQLSYRIKIVLWFHQESLINRFSLQQKIRNTKKPTQKSHQLLTIRNTKNKSTN